MALLVHRTRQFCFKRSSYCLGLAVAAGPGYGLCEQLVRGEFSGDGRQVFPGQQQREFSVAVQAAGCPVVFGCEAPKKSAVKIVNQ
jgi:hypothetical protein